MKLMYALALWIAAMACFPLYAQDDEKQRQRNTSVSQGTQPVEISANENVVRVKNAPEGSVLEIYSVVGIKVKEIEMRQPSGEYYVNLAKGYYIIRIGETVRKIAIR